MMSGWCHCAAQLYNCNVDKTGRKRGTNEQDLGQTSENIHQSMSQTEQAIGRKGVRVPLLQKEDMLGL